MKNLNKKRIHIHLHTMLQVSRNIYMKNNFNQTVNIVIMKFVNKNDIKRIVVKMIILL